MVKKYRWVKIEEDFFRQKEMKVLRKLERGDVYIIIYQKMMVYSLKNNNRIYFDNVESSFAEEIALMIDEEAEDIKATLSFLEKVHLIEWVSDDEFIMTQVSEITGSECDSAQRVRKHRENKKKLKNETLCNKNVTLEKDKELEKELELDTDTDKDTDKDHIESVCGCEDENLKQITKLYEQNIGPLYPANRQWFVETSEKIPWNLFEKAIEICIDKSNVTPSYLKGIIKRWMDQKIYTLEDFNAKQMELVNRKNQLKKKPKPKASKSEPIDENILREIELLESKLGVN